MSIVRRFCEERRRRHTDKAVVAAWPVQDLMDSLPAIDSMLF